MNERHLETGKEYLSHKLLYNSTHCPRMGFRRTGTS